jgi:hypothetical protein
VDESRDADQASWERVLLVMAIAFILLVGAFATLRTGSLLGSAIRSFPRGLGADGAVLAIAGVALLLLTLVAAVIAARSRLTDLQLLLAGLVLVGVVRLAVLLTVDAPLANDGLAYRDLAQWLAGGGCCFADRPTGYPALLAAAYAAFGDGSLAHEAINLAAAMIGGGLIFWLSRDAFGRGPATVGIFGFAVLPTQVLLAPVLLTDVVYTTLIIGLCAVAIRIVHGGLPTAIATGVLLAVTQYVRPVGPALLPAVALLPILWVRPLHRAWTLIAALVLAFAVAMLPVIVNNLAQHGELSVSTSSYGGWSLFMGTNHHTNGRYSDGDAAIIRSLPGDTLWDRSEAAQRLGVDRITADPAGFVSLALRKFNVMWGTEDYGVVFAFRPDGRPAGGLAGIDLVAQLAYVGTLAAALAVVIRLLRSRRRPAPIVILVIGLLLMEALVHTFLEVKPRYHAHLVPLLLLLASGAAAGGLVPAPNRNADMTSRP